MGNKAVQVLKLVLISFRASRNYLFQIEIEAHYLLSVESHLSS